MDLSVVPWLTVDFPKQWTPQYLTFPTLFHKIYFSCSLSSITLWPHLQSGWARILEAQFKSLQSLMFHLQWQKILAPLISKIHI